MDAARSALRSGAASVTVAYRRGRADMPAQVEEIEAAAREGVAIRPGLAVAEVVGREGAVAALRCVEQRPTGEVERGRATWAPVPDSTLELPATTVLVAVGEEPVPPSSRGSGIRSRLVRIVADPYLATGRAGSSPGATSCPDPRPSSTPSPRPSGGRLRHEFLAGVRDARWRSSGRSVRDAAQPNLTLDHAPGRDHAPLPVSRRLLRGDASGHHEATARGEAARCSTAIRLRRPSVAASRAVAGRSPGLRAALVTPPRAGGAHPNAPGGDLR